MHWQFWIDVGGTFTDCVARSPEGAIVTVKVLSSGVTKGLATAVAAPRTVQDPARRHDPEGFWIGYRFHLVDDAGRRVRSTTVRSFDSGTGTLGLADDLAAPAAYELEAGEEAPILAIRRVLGLPLAAPIPPCEVRLGTTRGTNALLERRGARTALVATRGFADVLHIGNQDRPRLFDLAIRKPTPLCESVLEIDERVAADGTVLLAPQADALRRQLEALAAAGTESLAICLLHAWTMPEHERLVERLARETGFREVSVSHRVAPRIKLVPRAETTVLDAYLNPILREYVEGLHRALGGGPATAEPPQSPPSHDQQPKQAPRSTRLRLMTSVGGLVSAEHFTGKDCLLSGPAGGVIGFSRVAQRAGFPRAIGFDMGGTSTDVSRYDGRYELEYEATKAGVRIAAPMLAIETVAAGGGSICGFDGVQLFVGPRSAGADPGPACYGRGGPLTVTDVNLALGKLRPEEFPFPLHRAAVEERLAELCEQIAASPLGRRYAPLELAEGFVTLANALMSRAIRKISVAKGYDPADYVLVTFGGAGGQHACAIADSLGMRSILVHPLAGVLSALGIGLADVRRHAERPILRPYGPDARPAIEAAFRELEETLRREVEAEGIPPPFIEPATRSLDLRYRGVEGTLTIVAPAEGDYAAAYEAQHEQVYGYRRRGRELEVVTARVEVVGRTPEPAEDVQPVVPRRPAPSSTVDVWFHGAPLPTGLFHRRELQAGDELIGPAILCEPTSTLVIDPGWSGTVTARGELVLRRTPAAHAAPLRTSIPAALPHPSHNREERDAPDPVRLELFHQQFASIAEQMGVVLQRTAISTNVKERLDFSCAIFDPQGNLVVNAPHIPVHLGAMSETVRAVHRDHPDLRPGDVVVTNDPYRGGSHLPDVTVVTPVHEPGAGRLLFWTASRAHHAEIGGIVPGSLPPFSRNLAEEGVLIRSFRLVEGGVSREEELRRLLLAGPFPTRRVEDNLADVAAQVAANQLGARLLQQLVHAVGPLTVLTSMRQIQAAAAAKMRRALKRLGEREAVFTDHLDDGSPVSVRLSLRGEEAIIDFTGTGPVRPTNLNANRAIVTAAVMYVFRCLIDEDIPLNGGVLEPLTIRLPECLLNPPGRADPRLCPAIVGGNVETSQRVVDVLLGALGVAAASQGTMNNLTFGDATFGYYETICGGSGATPDADGADAVHTHMTNTRLTDVEILEHRYPVRVRTFSIRRGSGGRGQRRGGDGVIRTLEFLRPLQVSMLSQRRPPWAPFGLAGGGAGASGRNTLLRRGEETPRDLGGCFQIDVAPGDLLTIETPGGGAYGAPGPDTGDEPRLSAPSPPALGTDTPVAGPPRVP